MVSGTFCDLPSQLLNDFRRLGIAWFKTYFQRIRDVPSRWVWLLRVVSRVLGSPHLAC